MVILETTRPPADDAPAEDAATPTSTPQYPELATSEEPTEDPENPAAVDATFAVSLLKIEGRLP